MMITYDIIFIISTVPWFILPLDVPFGHLTVINGDSWRLLMANSELMVITL